MIETSQKYGQTFELYMHYACIMSKYTLNATGIPRIVDPGIICHLAEVSCSHEALPQTTPEHSCETETTVGLKIHCSELPWWLSDGSLNPITHRTKATLRP